MTMERDAIHELIADWINHNQLKTCDQLTREKLDDLHDRIRDYLDGAGRLPPERKCDL